jgi:YD repeat-containing protein
MSEVRFSDFEATTSRSFSASFTPSIVVGRHGSKAIALAPGTVNQPNYLIGGVTCNKAQRYLFSCWLKAGTAGTLTVRLLGSSTQTITIPFSVSTGWKYCTTSFVNTNAMAGFSAEVSSNTSVSIDDVLFYPDHASVKTATYAIPFGTSIETDSRGSTIYYTYDEWGRIKLKIDQDGNILNKYDYKEF